MTSSTTETCKQLQDYKDDVKKQALEMLQTVFPAKVLELEALLKTEKFQLSRMAKIPTELNIPQPAAEMNHKESGKKRKLEDDGSILGTKVYVLPYGTVPCNKHIMELMEILKPLIIDLIEHSNKLKMWVTFALPKIEDGNNFGVSIQEDTLSEARQTEQEAATYLDQMSRYFSTRAKVASKVAKYPHLDDYRQSVVEIDEKQFISLRLTLAELRNNYAGLHDLITKNLEKIMKPRSANSDGLY